MFIAKLILVSSVLSSVVFLIGIIIFCVYTCEKIDSFVEFIVNIEESSGEQCLPKRASKSF